MQTVSFVHSGVFSTRPAEELAAKLAQSSGMERVLFNSGGSVGVYRDSQTQSRKRSNRPSNWRGNTISSEDNRDVCTLSLASNPTMATPSEHLVSIVMLPGESISYQS